MGFVVSLGLLVFLVRLLEYENSPMLCAGIYGGAKFIIGLLFDTLFFGSSIIALIGASVAGFILAYFYFGLLSRFSGTFFWWIVFIIGAFILFV
jgi:uncharacterized membrane protein YeaQ/YmgE (transglycosylase-associated protein family)